MNFKDYYEEVTFDVGEGLSRPLFATEGDTESRGLYVSLYDKDSQRITDLSNLSMTLTYRRADKQGDILSAVRDGSHFRIDFPLVMFSIAGSVQMELSLMGSLGEIITSRLFSVRVRENLAHDILDADNPNSPLGILMQFIEEEIPQIRQDELQRIQSEINRESAEVIRRSSESSREGNEIIRQQSENSRGTAEIERENAESSRIQSEISREEAESARSIEETNREVRESIRIDNMEVVQEWIDNPSQFKGDKGDSFEYLWDGTLLGVKTDKDENYSYVDLKGEIGEGLQITGSVNSELELPPTAEIGESYLINGYLYVWSGDKFINVGKIQGPQGERGPDIVISSEEPEGDSWWFEEI